jgi:hypothetical protein
MHVEWQDDLHGISYSLKWEYDTTKGYSTITCHE